MLCVLNHWNDVQSGQAHVIFQSDALNPDDTGFFKFFKNKIMMNF